MEYEEIIRKIKNLTSPDPELQKNFLKNINGLTIEYNCNEGTSNEIYEYNYNSNTVTINLYVITNIAKNQKEINDMINYALLCGLLQMSSTNYKRQIPQSCGFGKIIKKVHTEQFEYSTLTKAYTKLLASEIEQKPIEENQDNNTIIISKLLELIVGREIMLKAFFGNEENMLEKKLKKIDSELPIKDFLELITSVQQNSSEEIQYIKETLKRLFEKKLNQIKIEQEEKLQPEKNEFQQIITQTSVKFDQQKQYITDFEKALKISESIEEQQVFNKRMIIEMKKEFDKWFSIINNNKRK